MIVMYKTYDYDLRTNITRTCSGTKKSLVVLYCCSQMNLTYLFYAKTSRKELETDQNAVRYGLLGAA